MGGPVSRAHDCLFRGAIYLPMLAGVLAYTYLAPREYEGESYLALTVGADIASIVATAAVAWVMAYLAWTFWQTRDERLNTTPRSIGTGIHPGEWWVVLAHAVAFGSGYVLGASNASFLLVLAVHHEVQYLYFAYAMSRRSAQFRGPSRSATGGSMSECYSTGVRKTGNAFQSELRHAAFFFVWPAIGFGGAVAGGWLALEWLAPLGAGGLFCHYWLDGRIWTRQRLQN
jgi:hypothetical protein